MVGDERRGDRDRGKSTEEMRDGGWGGRWKGRAIKRREKRNAMPRGGSRRGEEYVENVEGADLEEAVLSDLVTCSEV